MDSHGRDNQIEAQSLKEQRQLDWSKMQALMRSRHMLTGGQIA